MSAGGIQYAQALISKSPPPSIPGYVNYRHGRKATLLYAQPKLPLHHHGWPEPLSNQVPGCTRRDYISWLQQTVSIKQSPAIARRRLAAALAVTQIQRHAARKKSDGRLDLGSRRTLPIGKKPGAGKFLWRRIKRREARVPRSCSCSHWRWVCEFPDVKRGVKSLGPWQYTTTAQRLTTHGRRWPWSCMYVHTDTVVYVSIYGKGTYLQHSAGRPRPLICPSASATLFEPLSTCHASPSYTHSAEPPLSLIHI